MTDDHLSLDELAELDEGLLAPERTSAARAHLHGCASCRAQVEALSTTRSMLSDLPAVTMPPEVQARLDQALADAAEGEDRPTPIEPVPLTRVPDEADDQSYARPERVPHTAPEEGTVVPAPGAVSRPRFGRPTLPTTAVAAAIVLAVGAIVVGAVNHHGGGTSETGGAASATAPLSSSGGGVIASTQPRNFIKTSTGRDYTTADLASDIQGLIAAPTDSTLSPTTPTTPSPAARHQAASSTRGTPDRKQAKRPDRAASNSAAFGAASTLASQPIPKILQPLASSRAKILKCAATLTGTKNAVPLAVDFGTWSDPSHGYNRSPSAIFVFKAANPAKVAVWVIPPTCDGSFEVFANVEAPH